MSFFYIFDIIFDFFHDNKSHFHFLVDIILKLKVIVSFLGVFGRYYRLFLRLFQIFSRYYIVKGGTVRPLGGPPAGTKNEEK